MQNVARVCRGEKPRWGKRSGIGKFVWRYAAVNGTKQRCDKQATGSQKKQARPIEQICLESGRVIDRHDSVVAAAVSLGSASQAGNIAALLKAEQTGKSLYSVAGFFWRYVGSAATPPHKTGGACVSKPVEQLCLTTGRIIARHDSISAAAASMGISSPVISSCCRGVKGAYSAAGYFW